MRETRNKIKTRVTMLGMLTNVSGVLEEHTTNIVRFNVSSFNFFVIFFFFFFFRNTIHIFMIFCKLRSTVSQ